MVECEYWKTITTCSGYEASSFGRIRSVDRLVETSNGQTRRYKGRVLNPSVGTNGYKMTTVSGRFRTLHRMVADAFGMIEEGREIDHINGDRTDNRPANLRSVTRSENQLNRHVKVGKSHDLPIGVYRIRRKWRTGLWYAVRKTTKDGNIKSTSFRSKEDAIKCVQSL